MGIRITNSPDAYDHILMTELSISQTAMISNTDDPGYSISYAYRRYKINLDNSIEYATGANDYISGFYTIAVANAGAGDTRFINALGAVQAAVAQMIEETTTYLTEIV